MTSEFDGGTIINQCPHCGQFCKSPNYYHAEFDEIDPNNITYLLPIRGCFADSYCKRCKKDVKLPVEFI